MGCPWAVSSNSLMAAPWPMPWPGAPGSTDQVKRRWPGRASPLRSANGTPSWSAGVFLPQFLDHAVVGFAGPMITAGRIALLQLDQLIVQAFCLGGIPGGNLIDGDGGFFRLLQSFFRGADIGRCVSGLDAFCRYQCGEAQQGDKTQGISQFHHLPHRTRVGIRPSILVRCPPYSKHLVPGASPGSRWDSERFPQFAQQFRRDIPAVGEAGITGLGMEYDQHFAAFDLPAQALDPLLQGGLVTVVGAVAGDEVLQQALQGIGVEQGVRYQHGVYFPDDGLNRGNPRAGLRVNDTLSAFPCLCGAHAN